MSAERLADYGIRPMDADEQQRRDVALIVIRSRLRRGEWLPLPPVRRPR